MYDSDFIAHMRNKLQVNSDLNSKRKSMKHLGKSTREHLHNLGLIKKALISPSWFGSVFRASAGGLKGPRFGYSQGGTYLDCRLDPHPFQGECGR